MTTKKKVLITIASLLLLLLSISGVILYKVYDKAGSYVVGQVLESQLAQTLAEEIGLDLSGPNRELTEEEIDKLFGSSLATGIQPGEKQQATQPGTTVPTQPDVQIDTGVTQQVEEQQGITVQDNKKPTITIEDVKQGIKDQVDAIAKVVPQKDKQAMVNLVLTNVPMADIQYLIGLASDGLSAADITEAKRIALRSFDGAELEQVRMYYYKYKHLIP